MGTMTVHCPGAPETLIHVAEGALGIRVRDWPLPSDPICPVLGSRQDPLSFSFQRL